MQDINIGSVYGVVPPEQEYISIKVNSNLFLKFKMPIKACNPINKTFCHFFLNSKYNRSFV